MKTKKALLPILASALLLTMGLAACNNSTPVNPGSSSGEAEEVKIEITSEGGKKEIQVGETLQLTASVEGVTWSTKSTDIVSVSETGLVTALKDGSARITAKKDGYANGSFTVTVLKAPEKDAKYHLGLEQAEHTAPMEEGWGAYFFGTWYTGPFDTPVENNNGATADGTSIGNLYTGCIEKLTFTSDKAVKVGFGMSFAYASEVDLAATLSIKFNDVAVDLTGKTTIAPETENNYYEFHNIELGEINLLAGSNVLEIELIGNSGVNMDDVLIYTEETLQLAVVPAVEKPKVTVAEAEVAIKVEETAQITSELTGLSYASADEAIATVSNTGLITGVAKGKTTITVSKEGYRSAKVNVTVSAKPVADQVVLEAEDAILPEDSTIQIADFDGASGGKTLGYFSAGQTFSLVYNAPAAKEVSLTLVAAACELDMTTWSILDLDLAANMELKLNGTAIDLTGKTLPGNSSFNFNDYHDVELGKVNLVAGENKFEFTAVAQGPNIDCLLLTGEESGDKVNVTFDANGGSGTMAAVRADLGEYTLPECAFTAPGTKLFAGWEYTVKVEFWGQVYEQQKVGQPGDKIELTEDLVLKATWKVAITKTEQVDLTGAFIMEAEDAVIAGAQTQQGGSPIENNESSHGGKDVGYMAAGASITFNFNASAAGQVKLVLMGRSANADWSDWTNPKYYDHALEETTSIKVNNADVDVTGKGFLGSDARTSVQVDLGNVNVAAGANTIVISAIAQTPNIDCIALISANGAVTFTLPQA